ncbi:MAG: M20 family metallopeptidase [Planctomycetota bacterium JB042]
MNAGTDDLRRRVEARRDDVISLLRETIAIGSITGEEEALATFCAGWLADHGAEVHTPPAKGRRNVVGVVGAGTPAVVLSGHLDTVPPNAGAWSADPLDPVVRDGRVYGLGASDLKASLAAAYVAADLLREEDLPGRVVTAFTVEEETTGDGTRAFLEWADETSFLAFDRTLCVVTEPTGLSRISLGSRGALFLRLDVTGHGGHGSRPHLSRSPIVAARRILAGCDAIAERWRRDHGDPRFPDSTITATSLNAGDLRGHNVVPQIATLMLDCRLTPSVAADDFAVVRRDVGALLDEVRAEGFEIAVTERYPRPGHELAADHPWARAAVEVVVDEMGFGDAGLHHTPAGNDACFFGERGVPTINKLGPGLPECAHVVDEFVPIENVVRAVELYVRLARRGLRLLDGPAS